MVRKILHVGLHKTGTTSVQRALKGARRKLAAEGLHYPSLRPLGEADMAGHHALGRLISEDHQTHVPRLRSYVDTLCAPLCASDTLFLSTESFYRYVIREGSDGSHFGARKRYVEEMVKAFGADCEVVLTARRPDSFALSVYQESIKKTSQPRQIQEYIKATHIMDMADNIALFAAHFARVHVLVFEEMIRHPHGLAAAMFDGIGVQTEVSVLPVLDPANVSLHPYLVEYKRVMNHTGFDRQGSATLVAKLAVLQHDRTLDCLKDTVSLLSLEDRQAILQDRQGDIDRIASHMGRASSEVFPKLEANVPDKMHMTMPIFEAIHAAICARPDLLTGDT